MKKISVFFLAFLFLLGLGVSSIPAHAAEASNESYAISILKYKLSDSTVLSSELPMDGTKVDQVVDENGNVLAPLPGISYEITRVSPVQGQSTFEPVVGEDAFSITVTTDQNGLARVADLASGTYQVIEKDNQLLKSVMDPVIVEVPLPQREGEALKEVFLYPKSSVVESTETPPPGTTPDGGTQRLPQTSGNIGNAQPLYLILVFIISMGAIGIKALKTKHNKF
ncbi:cell wall protein [Enterococcus casseliflavus]|jgi:hypothetical protein|uniref:pilin N-terminal domain-containing protein n=1 Tax=Enterococcus casseliflavus TaxID=37734 RepID=UPI000FFB1CFF|nr:pilin N-terminal domain-containing protein [Enterococcus casseliflavus]RXA65676.1 cell wall protein [Enterococcus casseliflavus]